MEQSRSITIPRTKPLRNPHIYVISAVMASQIALHYAEYIPGVPPFLYDLINSRFRVIFDVGLLIVVIYAGTVFRLKGSSLTLAMTSVVLMPLLIASDSAERNELLVESRNQAIEVSLVLLVGAMIITLQEFLAVERQEREQLGRRLDSTARQLSALNRMTQRDLGLLFSDLRDITDKEWRLLRINTGAPSFDRYAQFLTRVSDIAGGTQAPVLANNTATNPMLRGLNRSQFASPNNINDKPTTI